MSNLSPAPGVPQTNTKAVVAGAISLVVAGLGSLLVAVQSNAPGEPTITAAEWIVIALAVFTAPAATAFGTYKTQNHEVSGNGPDDYQGEHEAGRPVG